MRYYYTYLLIVLLFSCSKPVEIDLPHISQKQVVNCFFYEEEYFQVHVGKNIDIFSVEETNINNAKVLLFKNNILVDTLSYLKNGLYNSNLIKPEINNLYKIEVSTSDFNTVIAEDYLPEKIPIIKSSYTDSAFIDMDGYYLSQLSFSFFDPPQDSNYYEIKLRIAYKNPFDNTPVNSRIDYLYSNDIVIQNEGLLDYYPNSLLFSDKLINGKFNTLSVLYSKPGYILNDEELDYDYTLYVYLLSVTKNYYNYKKKLIKHIWNQTGDIWDGIGEPIQMYSNIENGYGIFAGYSVYIDTVQTGK